MKKFVVLTKLVKRWSECYFDKDIIGQLFWRIALIMRNHVKSAKNMVSYNKFQKVGYIRQ